MVEFVLHVVLTAALLLIVARAVEGVERPRPDAARPGLDGLTGS